MTLPPRLGLTAVLLGPLLTACTVLPPGNDSLASKGPSHSNSADACGRTWQNAKNCANFLIDQYTELDSNVGKIESGFGLTNLAAGTLGAIYLKSDEDRTQALEDLGVTVGALAGLRGFLGTEDKRKIVRAGVTAVQCMLDAAQATIDKAQVGNATFSPANFRTNVSSMMANGVSATTPGAAIGQDLKNANVPDASQVAMTALFTDRFLAVERAWAKAGQAARSSAGENCSDSASPGSCAAAKKLGAGLARIVSDVRLAWSRPVEGIDKLHETQRTLVNEQIGALVKAAEDQQEEQQKLEGAASMVPLGIETSRFVQALQEAAPSPETDAQILSIYSKCVTPPPASAG